MKKTTFIGLLALPCSLLAQEFDFLKRVTPFPFEGRDGHATEFPFLGGFNAPRPQFIDIDKDGDLDLFVQEENASFEKPGRVIYFENVGTPQNHQYTWRTDAYLDLDIGNWYKFADLDSSGFIHLFTENPFGVLRFWRNDSRDGEPMFQVLTDSLRDIQDNFIFFEVGSLPALGDIDCDGDLDLFIGRQAAGTISFYRYEGMSSIGIPLYRHVTDNFQNISIVGESPSNSAASNKTTLQNNYCDPDCSKRLMSLRGVFCRSSLHSRNEQIASQKPLAMTASAYFSNNLRMRHGANSLSMIDIDDDRDLDIFWGDFFEPSVVYLENSGTCEQPDIAITNRRFPQAEPLLSAGFNAPRFADIDADGDLDMFVAVLGGAFGLSQNLASNFYFYENTGDARASAFNLIDTQFISMLDIGTRSTPTLIDIDDDGDLDFFAGNEDDPDAPISGASARLYHFENVGSSTSPRFELSSKDYLGVDIGFNYAPVFADIDADLDFDLFVGEWDGKITFFENTGSRESPEFPTAIEEYAQIDVGNFNSPAFVDIDNDNDLDLFIGEFLGNINFYRNTGSPNAPTFTMEDAEFGGIDIGEHSAPFFVDADNDLDFDLLVGSERNGLLFYRNQGTPQAPNFVEDNAFSLAVQNHSKPLLHDIDADGDLDFFSGSERGGILFYENRKFVTSVEGKTQLPDDFALLQNYPNPFNPETTIIIRFRANQFENYSLFIFDLLGNQIRHWRFSSSSPEVEHKVSWNGTDTLGNPVASGVYFYKLHLETGQSATRKMMLIR